MRARLDFLLALPLLVLAGPGCALYLDDDDDDYCAYGGGEEEPGAPAPAIGLRNPETGQCEYYGGGGGGGGDPYPCDPECGPCPDSDYAEPAPQPTWGFCESQCTGLAEEPCLEASGCRGIYAEDADGLTYLECWATDMTGPIQGGSCEGLGAYECSRHDDCAAVHVSSCDSAGPDLRAPTGCPAEFVRCSAEPSDQVDPGQCYGEVLCESLPPECPEGSTPGILDGCWTGYCIPLDQCEDQPACSTIAEEASCIARPDCAALYEGVDCTCDDAGCVCADWLFERCE